jgi:hypothetical protein
MYAPQSASLQSPPTYATGWVAIAMEEARRTIAGFHSGNVPFGILAFQERANLHREQINAQGGRRADHFHFDGRYAGSEKTDGPCRSPR